MVADEAKLAIVFSFLFILGMNATSDNNARHISPKFSALLAKIGGLSGIFIDSVVKEANWNFYKVNSLYS